MIVWAFGIKKTLKVLGQHPALLLTTVFSNFTFGQREDEVKYLKVSWPLTWVNFLISSTEICFLWIYKGIALQRWPFDIDKDPDTFVSIPLLVLNFITLLLLHLIPKCKACCCQCCQTHCYPGHQVTALDPNQPFELIQWPLLKPEENIELQVIQSSNSIPNDIENDETRKMPETKNDIKLPVWPIFPDITACK